MTIVLQNYIFEFGYNVVNGFDLYIWKTATYVEAVALKINVKSGSGTIVLRQFSADEIEDIWTCPVSSKGEFVSPEFNLNDLDGVLLPVIEPSSEDLDVEMVFQTQDRPLQDSPYINYVVCTFRRPDYMQANAEIFLRAVQDCNLTRQAHLTIIDNGGDCGVLPGSMITIFANKNTGGAGGFGRGMYETCYGRQKDKSFTHVCLMDDDIYLHPEMFFRNAQLVRFLKPNHHIGAPMYPTSSARRVPRITSCIGHHFRGGRRPSDIAVGANLDSTDIQAFTHIDRDPHSTGWWWDCIPVEDIMAVGLPYPFFIKMDDLEYSLRLRNKGRRLVIPLSNWVLHDDFDEKYSASMQYFRFRNRWVLLSQQSRLGPTGAFRKEYYNIVETFLRKRQYEHAELMLNALHDYLKGPDYLVKKSDQILQTVLNITEREKSSPISELPAGSRLANGTYQPSSGFAKFLNRITLNNHFLPFGRSKITIDLSEGNRIEDCARGSQITYWNKKKGAGFSVETDSVIALRLYLMLLIRLIQIGGFPKVAAQYRERKPYFTSPKFWNSYGRSPDETELANIKEVPTEFPAMPAVQHADAKGEEATIEDRDYIFLNAVRNIHLGKRCFVIGNGPSLKIEDLDHLCNEYTFASNKIYLAFEQTKWRPTFYSVEDILVAKNNSEKITALEGMTKIFPDHMLKYIPRRQNHFYTKWLPPKDNRSPERHFSNDLSRGLCWGSTITYSLLQMAVHMGFKEIYLLGIDHNYVESKVKDKDVLISAGEVNHFHPDYRKPGERWNLPVLDRLEHSYHHAQQHCARIGVDIYNASRFTKLEAFPKVDLGTVLETQEVRR